MCRYKYELSFGTMANKYGCGCTGIRNCSLCQAESNAELNTSALTNLHWFCPLCDRIFPGNIEDYISTFDDKNWCEMHKTEICSVSVEGICVVERFIDDKEENLLLDSINRHDWKLSQSGRRKQVSCMKFLFNKKLPCNGYWMKAKQYLLFWGNFVDINIALCFFNQCVCSIDHDKSKDMISALPSHTR